MDQQELTSEELFGDVIQDVIKAEPAAPKAPEPEAPKAPERPQAPAAAAPVVPPPPPSPTKAPAPSRPSIDVDKALGSDLISTGRPTEDSQVRRMKARSDSDLSRKLEETLGGVKLASTAPKEAPKAAVPAPPAPVVVSPVPPPEPPKVEPPKAEAVLEPPKVESPKAEAAPEPLKAEPPKPEPVPEAPKAEAPKPSQVPESVSAGMEKAKAEKEGGVTYGNYLLVDKIATGGMAELFKARQKGLEGFSRIVAIKRILPHLAANQDFVTMFIDEAKLAAQLNHPNVCHIYDLGKMEDSYFIAMEYVEGKDLRAILQGARTAQAPHAHPGGGLHRPEGLPTPSSTPTPPRMWTGGPWTWSTGTSRPRTSSSPPTAT